MRSDEQCKHHPRQHIPTSRLQGQLVHLSPPGCRPSSLLLCPPALLSQSALRATLVFKHSFHRGGKSGNPRSLRGRGARDVKGHSGSIKCRTRAERQTAAIEREHGWKGKYLSARRNLSATLSGRSRLSHGKAGWPLERYHRLSEPL